MFCNYKKLVIEILNLPSFKSCGIIKIIINVSEICTVHDMWDIPCTLLCNFTTSSHTSLKRSLVKVRHTWWGVQNNLSMMSTGVTFLHSNLLKGNREPGFRQMQDCESLASHVTVYHSQLLYIDVLSLCSKLTLF
jgi:hypothetical protein